MTMPPEYELFRRRAWPPQEQFIWTFGGRKFFALATGIHQIEIDDIAQGISRKYRFAGQSHIDYTVAQHSVVVSQAVEQQGVENALWGLLHDAAEAWLPDWPTPFKRAQAWYDVETNRFFTFTDIEMSIMVTIAQKYELIGYSEPPCVREADLAQRSREFRDLFPAGHPAREALAGQSDLPPIELPTWTPSQAKVEFLGRFHELMAARQLEKEAA